MVKLGAYVQVIDPGNPDTFVCVPEDRCTAAYNPCPGGGRAVCKSSPYEFQYQCQCNPSEGYNDRSLTGGFCLKMWYYNGKVDLEAMVGEKRVNMFYVVKLMDIASTEDLRELVKKSRSKMFGKSQYVVADFSGTLVIDEQAFYEVRCAVPRLRACVVCMCYSYEIRCVLQVRMCVPVCMCRLEMICFSQI